MSDLFGDDSGSDPEVEDAGEDKSTPPKASGGITQNGVESEEGVHQNGEEAEEEEEEEGVEVRRGPRDDIKVSVTGFQKTADDHTFDVEVEVNGKKSTFHRSYKELQWLHRNLTRKVELGGNILPPMPAPPPKNMDPRVVAIGEKSRALYGDHRRLPCLAAEIFLQSLADHRFFSENNTVHTYLVKEQVEQDERLGAGSIWSSFTKSISDLQKSGVQDTEEEFTKFLKNVEELSPKLQEAAKALLALLSAQLSMAVSQFLLAEMLWEHSNWSKDKNSCASILDKLAGGVNEEKEYLIATTYDGRHTLCFTFGLYHDYCTQAKEMLYRRLGKLQTLFSCTSTLDKAKPEKKEAAQIAKDEADRAFKAISETARGEDTCVMPVPRCHGLRHANKKMEEYTVQYAVALRESLVAYTQAQLHHSKQALSNLTKLRDELADISS